jgi:hypothetical protein|tara:strand:- start:3286 stop:3699 length:414 start_codon:yes stop_codon:yes gene_type:complete
VNDLEIQGKKLYTPLQIFFGSLFFGPFFMLYLLWKNFYVIGKFVEAKKVINYGSIFIVILVTCLQLAPNAINPLIPGLVIPFLYALVALQISTSLQLNKAQILDSQSFSPHQIWVILGYGVIFYIPWIATSFLMQYL